MCRRSWIPFNLSFLLSESKAETAYRSGHQQFKRGALRSTYKASLVHRLSLGLLAYAIPLAALPVIAEQDGSAANPKLALQYSTGEIITAFFTGVLYGERHVMTTYKIILNQTTGETKTQCSSESHEEIMKLWQVEKNE